MAAGSKDTLAWRDHCEVRAPACSARLYTIRDVAATCGLPAAVIMQLVPRTWTAHGWMYTREQVIAAVEIAGELRTPRLHAEAPNTSSHHWNNDDGRP